MLRLEVESKRPVVDVSVVRLRAEEVGFAAEDAPVHVVQVFGRVRSADLKVDTVGEVGGEIVDGPVLAELLEAHGLGDGLVAVAVLAGRLVRGTDAPELGAGAFGGPGRGGCLRCPCFDLDPVLGVFAEDAVRVYGETVGSGFHGRYRDAPGAVDVAPVLVRVVVDVVVLEVNAIEGQYGEGTRRTLGKGHGTFESATSRRRQEIGDVWRNRVVEWRPVGRHGADGVFAELL